MATQQSSFVGATRIIEAIIDWEDLQDVTGSSVDFIVGEIQPGESPIYGGYILTEDFTGSGVSNLTFIPKEVDAVGTLSWPFFDAPLVRGAQTPYEGYGPFFSEGESTNRSSARNMLASFAADSGALQDIKQGQVKVFAVLMRLPDPEFDPAPSYNP